MVYRDQEAIKQRNKEKFKLEAEETLEKIRKLEYGLVNILGNVNHVNDIEPAGMNIMNGIRRDILLGIENIKRIERELKIGK